MYDCRMPSDDELIINDGVLEITPNVDKWEPRTMDFDLQEDSMVDFQGNVKVNRPKEFVISAVAFRNMDPTMFHNDFLNYVDATISSVRFSNDKVTMDPSELAGKWNISDKVARRTIAVTTRLCPRNTSDISLSQRYSANERILRYRHLPVSMFSRTMYT